MTVIIILCILLIFNVSFILSFYGLKKRKAMDTTHRDFLLYHIISLEYKNLDYVNERYIFNEKNNVLQTMVKLNIFK